MKQTIMMIAFFALWMSAMAQVDVTKKLIASESDAYRVNTGVKTGIILLGMGDAGFLYGELLPDNTVQMFPPIPEIDIASVNDFVYCEATNKWYAGGAGWPSGTYSYEYDPKNLTWKANPFNTNGPIQYFEQIKNGIVITGGFTKAGIEEDEFVHTCMFTNSGMEILPNNEAAVRTIQKSGAIFVSALQEFGVTDNVRMTNSNTGEALPMPLLPLGHEASGIAYDAFSGTVYAATWQPYGGNEFKLVSAKSGDAEWTTLLPNIGGQTSLQFQNGLVVAYGSRYDDGIKVSTSALWLYNPVTQELIDPMAEKNWCPVNTLFIDCEAKGENLVFTAWSLKKGGNDITIAKLKFLPAPEKVASNVIPLKMYPNPANGYIMVEGTEEIKITDMTGRIIEIVPSGQIDVSDFLPAVYFANGQPFIVTH